MSKVSLAGNASGTGIFTIASPNSNTDRTLTLPDNTGTLVTNTSGSVSQSMLASGVAGTGPAFSVSLSGNSALTAAAYTVVPFNAEDFDTANCYSTSTYRFTPTVAGYYALSGSFTTTDSQIPLIFVYKNGSPYKRGAYTFSAVAFQINMSCLVYLNGSTDYVQLIARTESNSTMLGNADSTWFQGYMVRAA
jgi:hypothetical protein